MDKKSLSERDICTKFITPALRKAGWDEMAQIREEVSFTKGRIIVRGKLVSRGKGNRADYILYYKPNIPIALIEAKDNTHAIGDGMQQGLDYAEILHIPFAFSSSDGFVFHDRTGAATERETTLGLDAFPPPGELWERYRTWKALTPESESIVLQDYFDDDGGKAPRYYQVNAINATIEAIAKGRDRILLVMAAGTGKTDTAFQIIWRLWKAAMTKLSTQAETIQRANDPSRDPHRATEGKRRIDTTYEATACLAKDREEILAFYDFPAEHWPHLRTTNPIESTFAIVKLRTAKTRGCLSRQTTLTMVFKLCLSAGQRWRQLQGFRHLGEAIENVKFINGIREDEVVA